jgi:hypothetical protein
MGRIVMASHATELQKLHPRDYTRVTLSGMFLPSKEVMLPHSSCYMAQQYGTESVGCSVWRRNSPTLSKPCVISWPTMAPILA